MYVQKTIFASMKFVYFMYKIWKYMQKMQVTKFSLCSYGKMNAE
jgi:hypothetical protein